MPGGGAGWSCSAARGGRGGTPPAPTTTGMAAAQHARHTSVPTQGGVWGQRGAGLCGAPNSTVGGACKCSGAVRAAGGQCCAVPPTPSGTPCPGAMGMMRKITHPGDKLPASAGRGAPCSIHGPTPHATTTHTNHTTHACPIAAVRAAARAMRACAVTRATNHGLLQNMAAAPEVVPTPALHAPAHDNAHPHTHTHINVPTCSSH